MASIFPSLCAFFLQPLILCSVVILICGMPSRSFVEEGGKEACWLRAGRRLTGDIGILR